MSVELLLLFCCRCCAFGKPFGLSRAAEVAWRLPDGSLAWLQLALAGLNRCLSRSWSQREQLEVTDGAYDRSHE